MQLVIDIKTDNAAFVENAREVAEIVEDLSTRLPDDAQEYGGEVFGLYDDNGNCVGECWLFDDDDTPTGKLAAALYALLAEDLYLRRLLAERADITCTQHSAREGAYATLKELDL